MFKTFKNISKGFLNIDRKSVRVNQVFKADENSSDVKGWKHKGLLIEIRRER